MDPPARRQSILRLLYRRGNMTLEELAEEFGVSRRTIRRDIEILSLTEPIYTQTGRYGGGVFISQDHMPTNMYIIESEAKIIGKMISCAENGVICDLAPEEIEVINKLIDDYSEKEKQRLKNDTLEIHKRAYAKASYPNSKRKR